ncbi:DICT sensory domain-containing protein [Halovenus rubra]|uniref:DICT sensory domain-containing protein n=2 Tax=Halovenus rubra TaxID=869890 RepID=A0ABD5X760_9EURY|nr:DICT sensory domain-containing protein [Halovenus rubra]
MTLETFLEKADAPERSVAVLNRTAPEPFQIMLEKLFEEQAVSISEKVSEEYTEDTVALLENGEVVAHSPLKELQDAILLVNSDIFITGTRSLEQTRVPEVLDGLAGVRFSLRGYPESNTEKLLLILISRYIEKRAFNDQKGTLRSSFQRLSRLEDEQGTRNVYERVAATDVDVHVYGQPDWTNPPEFEVVMHGGYSFDFRSSWFVIHTPPEGSEYEPAALLAIEIDDREWDGMWTYDPEFINKLTQHIQTTL